MDLPEGLFLGYRGVSRGHSGVPGGLTHGRVPGDLIHRGVPKRHVTTLSPARGEAQGTDWGQRAQSPKKGGNSGQGSSKS